MPSTMRLLRLVHEELVAVMTRDRAEALVAETLGPPGERDVETLLAMADGDLRAALRRQLGRAAGDTVADRVCGALLAHVPSGIRRKRPPERTTPPPISVGVLHTGDRPRTKRLLAGLESAGFRGVKLDVRATIASCPAAAWVEAFLVPADLGVADARELAWWVAHRDLPALVVVWPLERVEPAWGKAIQQAVFLEQASFALLARTLTTLVTELRAQGGGGGEGGAVTAKR